MLNSIYMFILIMTILLLMMLMNFILSKKMFKDREKMSPFECGFDPLSKSRLPFSLQFYLISIIFLIFDVEIAVVLPFIYLNSLYFYFLYINMLFVVLILLVGLYYEWLEGALKWFK